MGNWSASGTNVQGHQGHRWIWFNDELYQNDILTSHFHCRPNVGCGGTCWGHGCFSSEDEPGARHGELVGFWNECNSG